MMIKLLLMLLLMIPTANAANILVINSYHNDFSWSQGFIEGLTETIDTQHSLTYTEMDTKRIPAEQFQSKADAAWQLFEEKKPDLVMMMDDNALKFLGERIANTGTPVVFMGINQNPRVYFSKKQIPSNVVGVLEQPLLSPLLRAIGDILKMKSQKVLLMMDDSESSKAIIDTTFLGKHIPSHSNMATLHTYLAEGFEQWQHKIHALKEEGYDAVILISINTIRDTKKQPVTWQTVASWTSEHSPVPVFTALKFLTGKSLAIGGIAINSNHQGIEAAQKANAILAGEKTVRISMPSKYEYLFSKSELKRWGLVLPKHIATKACLID